MDVDRYIRDERHRQARWGSAWMIAQTVGALALAVGFLFVNCNGCQAHDDEVLDAIRAQGLTHPDLGGAHPGACAENESSRRFTAINAHGARVSGTVCCGFAVKGCTIRW